MPAPEMYTCAVCGKQYDDAKQPSRYVELPSAAHKYGLAGCPTCYATQCPEKYANEIAKNPEYAAIARVENARQAWLRKIGK